MLTDNKVLADNDVDAADLHLLLGPTVREAHDFVGGLKMVIDPDQCTACGQCEPACRFGAIHPDGPIKDLTSKPLESMNFPAKDAVCVVCLLIRRDYDQAKYRGSMVCVGYRLRSHGPCSPGDRGRKFRTPGDPGAQRRRRTGQGSGEGK